MSRYFIFLAVFAFLINMPLFGDIVELVNGERLEGMIQAENTESVTLEARIGAITLPRDQIRNIRYDPAAYLRQAERLEKDTEYGKALAIYRKIPSLFQSDGRLVSKTIQKIALCQTHLNPPDQLIPILEELLNSFPASVGPDEAGEVKYLLARAYYQTGNDQKSADILRDMLASKSKVSLEEEARRLLDDVSREERLRRACDDLEAEYQKMAGEPQGASRAADPERLIRRCAQIVRDYPLSPVSLKAQLLIVKTHDLRAEYPEKKISEKAYIKMMAGVFGHETAMREAEAIADDYRLRENHKYAAEFYRLLSREAEDKAIKSRALYRYGESLKLSGKPDLAMKAFEKLIENFPGTDYHADALYALAAAHERAGRLKNALKIYEKIAREHPGDDIHAGRGVVRMGLYLMREKRYNEAKPYFEYARDHYPLKGKTAVFMLRRIEGLTYARQEKS